MTGVHHMQALRQQHHASSLNCCRAYAAAMPM